MSPARAADPPGDPRPSSDEFSTGVSAEAPSHVINGWSPSDREAEDALVAAARTDRAAFGALYDRHFDAIYHYIARRVGDPDVAEDLAAEVWERALTAIERYEIRGVPFVAWLYRIAGNLVANHHRKRRLWHLVPFAREHDVATPAVGDERTAVHQALLALSAEDQEVLGLCYFAGLAPPEIADIQGCTPAAVHKRLHRARERFRRHFEGDLRASPTTG
jgi:RNA polymerase sigma-70 factor, ECF subfamily